MTRFDPDFAVEMDATREWPAGNRSELTATVPEQNPGAPEPQAKGAPWVG
jgi:hypothetical protein